MNRFPGLVCLVTGSTGIAAARRSGSPRRAPRCSSFAERGPLPRPRSRVAANGGRAEYRAAELTDQAEVEAAVEACTAAFGRIDGLFSVAGGSGRRFGDGPIDELDGDAWDATLALNLRTQALVCGQSSRRMRVQEPRRCGHARLDPADGQRDRDRPRAGAVRDPRLRGGQGRDRRAHDGHGRDVCPRPDPGQRRRAVADPDPDGGRAPRATSGSSPSPGASSRSPGEMLDPAEVAHAAVYFLSNESRTVTGQLLKVDGGWSVMSVGAGRRDDVRPDRPRRHRPGRAGRHLRPRAPRHRRRAAGRSCCRTSCLDDVDGGGRGAAAASGRAPGGVDAMPATAAATRRSSPSCRAGRGPLVAPTGLHHERFYAAVALEPARTEDELADLFAADVTDGIDERDYGGPDRPPDRPPGRGRQGRRQRRRPVRARPADLRAAAAAAPSRTGVPVHTHCEAGTGAPRAAPGPCRRRRAARARSRSATSTRSSTAATTGSCSSTGALRGLRPGASAGETAPTARSSSSSGRSRTARSTR